MKIVLTGGSTGGHFYPLMAVAAAIHKIATDEKLISPDLYYIGPSVLDYQSLSEQGIIWKKSTAGKMRRYLSLKNVFDVFKVFIGIIQSLVQLYFLFPDVVFSKGGYASFPTTIAARLLGIPVIIHESDAHPGKANIITSKWAVAVATSFPDVTKYFTKVPKEKFALVGHPVRKELFAPAHEGAHEYLHLKSDVPTILVLGGSQGAQAINSVILNSLPELLKKYQVIHQTGAKNLDSVKGISAVILKDNPNKDRYRAFGFLNTLAMRMSSGIATMVIARSGAGNIFEIAAWGLPSIVIPIPENVSHDQTSNAFAFARDGAAVVLKQKNLTEHILVAEVNRILESDAVYAEMSVAAKNFAKPHAAEKMARIILNTALAHEK